MQGQRGRLQALLLLLLSTQLSVGLYHTTTETTVYHDYTVLVETGAQTEDAVQSYDADSGGCTPLTVWENHSKDSYWWNWEKRLPKLAAKIASLGDDEAGLTVFDGLGSSSVWMQYIDGWSHMKGENAFGPEYIADSRKAHQTIINHMRKGLGPKTFNVEFYDEIHDLAFKNTATLLSKRNGFRGPDSWIYLPMPDKHLGIFHDVHNYERMNYDPRLRVVDKMTSTYGLWYNGGFQYRWVYPNIPWWFGPAKVKELFNKFWWEISKIKQNDPIALQRDQALTAVVHLYHSLENFHCFVDGNGRTNMLVLQTLLSFVGLHPVSFYNSMESALCSVEEMKEKVLEGYFMWESVYHTGKTGWTIPEMDRKGSECKRATKQIEGKEKKYNFGSVEGQKPDTNGGCRCEDISSCDSNPTFNGKRWCYTDGYCTWKWDYCAGGRRQTD